MTEKKINKHLTLNSLYGSVQYLMDTRKIKIKTIHPQGRGHSVYLSRKDLAHLGIAQFNNVIFDSETPGTIKIMSIGTWRDKGNK